MNTNKVNCRRCNGTGTIFCDKSINFIVCTDCGGSGHFEFNEKFKDAGLDFRYPVERQKHYEQYDVQPIDYIVQICGPEWCVGNVVKYVSRYKEKGGVEDVYKAKHYCQMLINCLEGREPRDNG